jgi:hypothetical protein
LPPSLSLSTALDLLSSLLSVLNWSYEGFGPTLTLHARNSDSTDFSKTYPQNATTRIQRHKGARLRPSSPDLKAGVNLLDFRCVRRTVDAYIQGVTTYLPKQLTYVTEAEEFRYE